MAKLLIAILIGGAIGGLIGARRSCETGACPLTSNPYRGALYGAVLGFFLVSAVFGTTTPSASTEDTAMASKTSTLVAAIKNKEEFQQQILNATVPTLVDFWATWCAPCRAQMPIVEQVAEKAGDKARVVKVNVDEASDIAESLGISSIPTLVVFKGGKEEKRFVGVQSADTLSRALGL
jgi:thioredoxin 1